MNLNLHTNPPTLQELPGFPGQTVAADCLRLDQVHPVVSGNKWYKLRYWLEKAKSENKDRLLTFGGAYSNHVVATALAAALHGLASAAIIRGEEQELNSHTLQAARRYGMTLYPVSRQLYRQLQETPENIAADLGEILLKNNTLIIPEGGSGNDGIRGAATILQHLENLSGYTHIAAAVGTGTTLAGLLRSSLPEQQVIGISSLKGTDTITPAIREWVPESRDRFRIWQDFHFGGYARHQPELFDFMNHLYDTWNLPTDFVYTAKLLYGISKLAGRNYFSPGDRILIIHSGGLQGNLSLPQGTLNFLSAEA
ncbi:1-aminocyclopropane-1-carboxylate deaminase/D-cysteine desulfhydrase [Flavihumibacter petaseus]|uniref:Putative D-cysteine desulfhydrase n=1 Tax=Flavihumibacter petaseus NBRC 106054 TaxID=1220578 RepID=A0A0E9N0R4_9BACT|nr:pyridoxal-phosphate dependent enzyme [Flavihumibacter petaseus]GAO43602.1 putative D-cysteine desulfhydrase [Flavihumibacter petaseus NBRC 106054]